MHPVRTLGLLALVRFLGGSSGDGAGDGDGLVGLLLGSALDRFEWDGWDMVCVVDQSGSCTREVDRSGCRSQRVVERDTRGGSRPFVYQYEWLTMRVRGETPGPVIFFPLSSFRSSGPLCNRAKSGHDTPFYLSTPGSRDTTHDTIHGPRGRHNYLLPRRRGAE